MKKTIHTRKEQALAAMLMLVLSAGPIAASFFYDVPMQPALLLQNDGLTAPETSSELIATSSYAASVPLEEPYVPTPGELNMAHYFPEGADRTKISESYAGMAFQILMDLDNAWLNGIYDYSDYTPSQLSKQLGRSGGSLMGKYNPNDKRHDSNNPSTWTVNSFKKVQMTVQNGDGQAVSAYSNVIDIMSMANLYTYFQGPEDYDLFLSYCKTLWENSHSYSVKIGSLYYCNGCLGEEGERRELEELEAEAKAEALGIPLETSVSEETAAAATTAETTSAVIEAGRSAASEQQTTTAAETETVPESTSGVIVSGAGAQTTAAETAETSQSAETEPESSAAAETTTTATPSNAKESDVSYKCPGHVDLIISAKILGLDEENGLLAKDSLGNDPANQKEDGWPGWNQYTKASARLLASQDWYEKYGLSLSLFSAKNPLTVAEVEEYLSKLPTDLSQTRRDLIQFALSSVGKVPYYWGGKPSSPDYLGNSFGVLTTPDEKGRVLKGLDCSGWVSWVYWSVTGKRLAYEGTSGLAVSGTRIRRDELQPGDIIIRTGGDAHVIMFLGWTDDGRILCVHESSASVNNVTVGIRDANWPYYRKLVD